jgi:uncharacterized protein
MPPLPPIDEDSADPPPIKGVQTSVAAFLGETAIGPAEPAEVLSLLDFVRQFGDAPCPLRDALRGFFDNGGRRAVVVRIIPATSGPATLADYLGAAEDAIGEGATGLAALERADVALIYAPNALAIPGLAEALIAHCERPRDRFAVIDAPRDGDPLAPRTGWDTRYAAYYHPWLSVADAGGPRLIPPGGHVLGVYARVDTERGVHKAPANEVVVGALALERQVSAPEQGRLNAYGVNVIRAFQGRGIRIWGARTLASDQAWKYVNITRLRIFTKVSLKRGLQWVVFEPNGEALWAKVQDTVRQFLRALWLNGALQGRNETEAFFIRCDRTTMTQADIDSGRLICEIGIAPVRPAEFVVLRIGLWTADRG